MRKRTYISKFATIISDSEMNTGLNPIGGLVYGGKTSRLLLYFDTDRIKSMIEDKTFAETEKLTHRLHLSNAGSIDFSNLHCTWDSELQEREKVRATSFDLIFFLIPEDWDNGKGYEYTSNAVNKDYYAKPCGNFCLDRGRLLSTGGVNWYQARNGVDWKTEGIYSNEFLESEYEKYGLGKESIVVRRQHFDIGNEDVDIDLTDIVNGFIDGTYKNHGIGIAFSPALERSDGNGVENYVGFSTDKNPTFFLPYLETRYDNPITDDRSNFYSGRKNRLYLYTEMDGNGINLDELPKCEVNGEEYEVKQATKGVYYIEITIEKGKYKTNTMLYDTWSNIIVDGIDQGEVELDFTVKNDGFLNIGNSTANYTTFTPSLYGIDDSEKIRRGDIRRVGLEVKKSYDKGNADTVGFAEYRLYVMDGTKEITVFDWERVNTGLNENWFVIDTNDLIPNRYYVDIRLSYGRSSIIHHKELKFDIVSEKNNLY